MARKVWAKRALPMLILIVSCLFAVHPSAMAQSTNTVTLPLTFHGYSLILSDPNGSFCVYDGADGAPASGNTVTVNLNSQIPGQRSGFTYWSAVIIWAVQLPMDLHVVGTVNVHAYISSTFKLSGLFSGGGYAMGLVDIDQNNAEVKEFITEAPYTVGSNPFTATPTLYSLNTNIDYVFAKGHSIGFAVGLGATTQGFAATVYFGSQDRNSGATLPVEDTAVCQTFTFNSGGSAQTVAVTSNSAVSNCHYNSASSTLQFTAQGINYTTGYCSVAIPKTLMQAPFTVTAGATPINAALTQNSTYYQLDFSHTRTTDPIQITQDTAQTPAPTATSTSTSTTTSPTQPTQTTQTTQTTTTAATNPTATPPIPEYYVFPTMVILVLLGLLALAFKNRFRKTPQRQ